MLVIRFQRKYLIYVVMIIVGCVAYAANIKAVISQIEDDANAQSVRIEAFISRMHSASEVLKIQADEYLANDFSSDAELMQYFVYDETLDSYILDYPEDYSGNKISVTGIDELPTDEQDLKELNMALSLTNIFSYFASEMPEICWIYYTSENDYVAIYPWVEPEEFFYSDDLQELEFYASATPENNPSGEAVWTPVYVDSAGKGLMFTLSQPIYYEGEFLGVLSIDFLNSTLDTRFTTEYDCYILNEYDQILGTNNHEDLPDGVVTIEEQFGMSYEEIDAEVEDGSGVISGRMYIQELELTDGYFYGFISVPIIQIFSEAFTKTLPLILGLVIIYLILKQLHARDRNNERLKKSKEELEVLSITDALTNIHNRRKFEEEMYRRLESNPRDNFYLAVMDLDYFKKINDELGHDAGDIVLFSFAQIIIEHLHGYEESGVRYSRIGGEEFAIIFPNLDEELVKALCESLRAKVEIHNFDVGRKVTVSIGAAKITTDCIVFKDAFVKADSMLYDAKKAGRNKVFYDL